MAAILVIALYLTPMIVAISRDMPNKGSTIAINIFLGWTLVGWVVALAMALGDSSPRGAQVIIQNNLGAAHLGVHRPMAVQPALRLHPQQNNGVVWDQARQAYLYQNPTTAAWMIQSVDGAWLPLPQSPTYQQQVLPPPPLH